MDFRKKGIKMVIQTSIHIFWLRFFAVNILDFYGLNLFYISNNESL